MAGSDERPERRAAPLPVERPSGLPKHALEANANDVLAILHDVMNELRAAADAAKTAGQRALQVEALDNVGRLSLRYLELVTGRKMNLSVKVRSQEDLPDYRALPPEIREVLDAALDAMEAHREGRTILDVKALPPSRMNRANGAAASDGG